MYDILKKKEKLKIKQCDFETTTRVRYTFITTLYDNYVFINVNKKMYTPTVKRSHCNVSALKL